MSKLYQILCLNVRYGTKEISHLISLHNNSTLEGISIFSNPFPHSVQNTYAVRRLKLRLDHH